MAHNLRLHEGNQSCFRISALRFDIIDIPLSGKIWTYDVPVIKSWRREYAANRGERITLSRCAYATLFPASHMRRRRFHESGTDRRVTRRRNKYLNMRTRLGEQYDESSGRPTEGDVIFIPRLLRLGVGKRKRRGREERGRESSSFRIFSGCMVTCTRIAVHGQAEERKERQTGIKEAE